MRAPALFAAHRACAQNRASLSSLLARSYTRGLAVGCGPIVGSECAPSTTADSNVSSMLCHITVGELLHLIAGSAVIL